MNLQIVPKYVKYNNTSKQIRLDKEKPRIQARHNLPEVHVLEPKRLPVPVRVAPYKLNALNVKLKKTVSRLTRSNEEPIVGRKKKRKEIYDEPHDNKFVRWFAQRKALRELKEKQENELKGYKEWEKWKRKEAKRIQKEQEKQEKEEALQKREKELELRMHEINKRKVKFSKETHKMTLPFKREKTDRLPTESSYLDHEPHRDRKLFRPKPDKETTFCTAFNESQSNHVLINRREIPPEGKKIKPPKVKIEKPPKVKQMKPTKIKKEKPLKTKQENPVKGKGKNKFENEEDSDKRDKDDIYYKEPYKEEYNEPYKEEYRDYDEPLKKKPAHVKLRDSIFRWSKGRAVPVTDKNESIKIYDRPHDSKFGRWYDKKKAAHALKKEREKEKKIVKKLEKWKRKEEKRIQKAQALPDQDEAHTQREKEFYRQLVEIDNEKKNLIKDTLKTKYPYKVENRPPPPKFDYDDFKDTTPYYDDEPKSSKKKKTYGDDDLDYTKYDDTKKYDDYDKYKYDDYDKSKYDDYDKYKYDDYDKYKYDDYDKSKYDKDKYDDYDKYKYDDYDKYKYDDYNKYKYDDYDKYKYDEPQPSKYYDDYDKGGYGSSYYDEEKKTRYSSGDKPTTLSQKFASCFYRVCCEFYCWLTIFAMVIFTILLIA